MFKETGAKPPCPFAFISAQHRTKSGKHRSISCNRARHPWKRIPQMATSFLSILARGRWLPWRPASDPAAVGAPASRPKSCLTVTEEPLLLASPRLQVAHLHAIGHACGESQRNFAEWFDSCANAGGHGIGREMGRPHVPKRVTRERTSSALWYDNRASEPMLECRAGCSEVPSAMAGQHQWKTTTSPTFEHTVKLARESGPEILTGTGIGQWCKSSVLCVRQWRALVCGALSKSSAGDRVEADPKTIHEGWIQIDEGLVVR